jgi:hypothetical protein
MRKSLYLQGLRVQVAQRKMLRLKCLRFELRAPSQGRCMREGISSDMSLKAVELLISQSLTVRREFGKSHCRFCKHGQNLPLTTQRRGSLSWPVTGGIRRACAWCQSMASRSHPRDTDLAANGGATRLSLLRRPRPVPLAGNRERASSRRSLVSRASTALRVPSVRRPPRRHQVGLVWSCR